jgi:hypothetical protein
MPRCAPLPLLLPLAERFLGTGDPLITKTIETSKDLFTMESYRRKT